ncbi:MAG: lipopolysaccharide heptosyltransferase II [Planctomycetes bacterium RBG_13_46_10]|nr:MAG: lipopolysaccharide heptosyltransferase II [Planctomycetes bacterium RBG_13_46_10]
MQDMGNKILVWLPSPMGDAVLCTPALRAIRRHFSSSEITFLAEPVVREVLSPSDYNDKWLELQRRNPFAIAKMLKEHKFTHAILFKNSLASALAVVVAAIPLRIGYAREGRGVLLTEKLYPPKLPNGKYEPYSMIDYYLAIASKLGAKTDGRNLELLVDPKCSGALMTKMPEVDEAGGPVVIIVPGGAFGPSKCWPSDRFSQTADWLIDNYNATVVISVSPEPAEKKIAEEICAASKNTLLNLSGRNVSLGELKALFSKASLVITNDTGPRHIAIALQRKLVTLFGPNDPAWTETNYENEIQVVGNVNCAPCAEPTCKQTKHACMQAITVEMVCSAAQQLLENNRGQTVVYARQKFIKTSDSFFLDSDYKTSFGELGLTSIDKVFSFNAAKNLVKKNLAGYRSRLQFEVNSPSTTLFLKRYEKPPILIQLKNWLHTHSRKSCGLIEVEHINRLAEAGINTPKVISYGQQWGLFFEKRSFIITEKILRAESLERNLPNYFTGTGSAENLKLRRAFIAQLADFIKRFHETRYCHRDLYFSHIFYSDKGCFYLIDLARAFRPIILHKRFKIKDIAQLYYSAPAKYFSNTDRLHFYHRYTGRDKIVNGDKSLIRKILNKANRMAKHDVRHSRLAPFVSQCD